MVATVVSPTTKKVDSNACNFSPDMNAADVVPIPTFDTLSILVSVSHSLTVARIPDDIP